MNKTESQIVQLSFSGSELYKNGNVYEWKENNKELVINGVYHEVISVNKVGVDYQVLVIADKAENTLFQKYFALQKSSDKNLNDHLLLLLNLIYIQPESSPTTKAVLFSFFGYDQTNAFTESTFHLKLNKPPTFIYS